MEARDEKYDDIVLESTHIESTETMHTNVYLKGSHFEQTFLRGISNVKAETTRNHSVILTTEGLTLTTA